MVNDVGRHKVKKTSDGLLLGVVFTVLHILVFILFLDACVFHSDFLSKEFLETNIPVSFVMGAGVVLCGLLLTCIYVCVVNGQEDD